MSPPRCLHGHDLTDPDNAYRTQAGYVLCRPCQRRSSRQHRARKRELIADHDVDLPPEAPLYLIRRRIAEQADA